MAAFTPEQLDYLQAHFAAKPHTHTSDEVIVDTSDGETLGDYIEFMDSDEGESQ